HHQEGKDIAAKTLEVLKKYGYTGKQDNVYLQCFDVAELKRIKPVGALKKTFGKRLTTYQCEMLGRIDDRQVAHQPQIANLVYGGR
ncbi:hypothetical protein MJM95_27625, partial [Salmonella enterica subsp. enterica serovar Anatum]|nr:hypothetical protein [Salmonella enterica subsp. enterica serovar Anatum]